MLALAHLPGSAQTKHPGWHTVLLGQQIIPAFPLSLQTSWGQQDLGQGRNGWGLLLIDLCVSRTVFGHLPNTYPFNPHTSPVGKN